MMELKNLIMFTTVQSGTERDLIYERMVKAAQAGALSDFEYDDTWLIDEDKVWLRQQMLTLLEKNDII